MDASGREKQVPVVVLLAVDAAPRPGVSLTFQKNLRRRVQGPVHPAADGARHRRAAVVVPDGARTDLRCATRGDWLVFEWYLSGIRVVMGDAWVREREWTVDTHHPERGRLRRVDTGAELRSAAAARIPARAPAAHPDTQSPHSPG